MLLFILELKLNTLAGNTLGLYVSQQGCGTRQRLPTQNIVESYNQQSLPSPSNLASQF